MDSCSICHNWNRWTALDGVLRCAVCGDVLDGSPSPSEPTIVRTFDLYQQLAERTARRPGDTRDGRFANFALGLAGESGEVVDLLKKHLFHGHALDRERLAKELGDCLWYVATIATTADIPLSEIAGANIEKLRRRYPTGFESAASVARADEVAT